jgi:hypothetical protein
LRLRGRPRASSASSQPSLLKPKKANWDLKRDVEKKLAKLEKRTQRAMVDIAREEEAKRMNAA